MPYGSGEGRGGGALCSISGPPPTVRSVDGVGCFNGRFARTHLDPSTPTLTLPAGGRGNRKASFPSPNGRPCRTEAMQPPTPSASPRLSPPKDRGAWLSIKTSASWRRAREAISAHRPRPPLQLRPSALALYPPAAIEIALHLTHFSQTQQQRFRFHGGTQVRNVDTSHRARPGAGVKRGTERAPPHGWT